MPSREDLIDKHYWNEMRLQYHDEEEKDNPTRIERLANELTLASIKLIQALAEFKEASTASVSSDSASRMKYARRGLIEAWAQLQASVSAVPLTFHFRGEEAFNRFVESIADTDKPLNFSDL